MSPLNNAVARNGLGSTAVSLTGNGTIWAWQYISVRVTVSGMVN